MRTIILLLLIYFSYNKIQGRFYMLQFLIKICLTFKDPEKKIIIIMFILVPERMLCLLI